MENEDIDRLIDCVAFITGIVRDHPRGPEFNPEKEARRWIWYADDDPEEDAVWVVVTKDGGVAVELRLDDETNTQDYFTIIGFCAMRNIPCIVHTDDVRLGIETTVLGEDEDEIEDIEDAEDDDVEGETKH